MTRSLLALLLVAVLSGCATKAPAPMPVPAPDVPADAPAVYSLDIQVEDDYRDNRLLKLLQENLDIARYRDKYLAGLGSEQLEVVRASMSALMKLPRGEASRVLVPALRLLRRMLGLPREQIVRAQVLALLSVETGQKFQVREQDNVLLIQGAVPGAKGDYVVIRESKKLPKGSERAANRLAGGKPTGKAAKGAKK